MFPMSKCVCRVLLIRAVAVVLVLSASGLAVRWLGSYAVPQLQGVDSRQAIEIDLENGLAWLRAHEPADGSWRVEIPSHQSDRKRRSVFPLSFFPYVGPATRNAEPGVGADSRWRPAVW